MTKEVFDQWNEYYVTIKVGSQTCAISRYFVFRSLTRRRRMIRIRSLSLSRVIKRNKRPHKIRCAFITSFSEYNIKSAFFFFSTGPEQMSRRFIKEGHFNKNRLSHSKNGMWVFAFHFSYQMNEICMNEMNEMWVFTILLIWSVGPLHKICYGRESTGTINFIWGQWQHEVFGSNKTIWKFCRIFILS